MVNAGLTLFLLQTSCIAVIHSTHCIMLASINEHKLRVSGCTAQPCSSSTAVLHLRVHAMFAEVFSVFEYHAALGCTCTDVSV
jgi:hypothetical protein